MLDRYKFVVKPQRGVESIKRHQIGRIHTSFYNNTQEPVYSKRMENNGEGFGGKFINEAFEVCINPN